jgi:Mrp family chromosome partitioning ATPase
MEREMNRLHQSIMVLLRDSHCVIQFIGSRESEGTSTIVHEFGRFLGERCNTSVLLVDGDPLRMSQHQAFRHHPGVSLQQAGQEGGSLDEAIFQVRNSRVFLCRLAEENGGKPDLSLSMNMRQVWDKLRKKFRFVLVDSPSMDGAADALPLCSSVDGVVLVVEAEKTRSQVAASMKDRVIQNGGNTLGIVFNKQRYYIPEWIYKRL